MATHEVPTRIYTRPSEAGWRNPKAGHDPIREVGPTPEALALLDTAAKGARVVIRTGPGTYEVFR